MPMTTHEKTYGFTLYTLLGGKNINDIQGEYTQTIPRVDVEGRPGYEEYNADVLIGVSEMLATGADWDENHKVLVKARLADLWRELPEYPEDKRAKILYQDDTPGRRFRVVLYFLKSQIGNPLLIEIPLYGIFTYKDPESGNSEEYALCGYYTLDFTETSIEDPYSEVYICFNIPPEKLQKMPGEDSPLITVQEFGDDYWCVTTTGITGPEDDVKYYPIFVPKHFCATENNPNGPTILHIYPRMPIPVSIYMLPVLIPEWVWDKETGEALIIPRSVGEYMAVMNNIRNTAEINLNDE